LLALRALFLLLVAVVTMSTLFRQVLLALMVTTLM